jgi:hypothetical protein
MTRLSAALSGGADSGWSGVCCPADKTTLLQVVAAPGT